MQVDQPADHRADEHAGDAGLSRRPAGPACSNCGTALAGPYCHHCGQAARSFIRALPGLAREIAAETLYYDSRMWRTLKALLLRPGWLSQQYVSGRRASCTPPFRLYLLTSLLAFLLVTLMINTREWSGLPDGPLEALDDASASVMVFGQRDWHPENNPLRLDWLGESGNAWLNAQLAVIDANTRATLRNPARTLRTASAMLPQTMFVILPLFSAWVALFYLFARRYYIEHLLLQLHNHAFLFLSLVGLYLIAMAQSPLKTAGFAGHGLLSGLLSLLTLALWLWMPVYVLISMKRFYAQGWLLTTAKYLALGLSYLCMLTLALGTVIILGVWRL